MASRFENGMGGRGSLVEDDDCHYLAAFRYEVGTKCADSEVVLSELNFSVAWLEKYV